MREGVQPKLCLQLPKPPFFEVTYDFYIGRHIKNLQQSYGFGSQFLLLILGHFECLITDVNRPVATNLLPTPKHTTSSKRRPRSHTSPNPFLMYCGGLNTYHYQGAIFLIQTWYQMPQIMYLKITWTVGKIVCYMKRVGLPLRSYRLYKPKAPWL